MRTLALPHHSLSLYRTVEDFPIGQFLRYQDYWEQALSETFIQEYTGETPPHALAFAVCVAAISGHPVEPLPDTELPTLLALLRSYGVTDALMREELAATRTASLTELKRIFPVHLADLTAEAMTDAHLQRRFVVATEVEIADLAAYQAADDAMKLSSAPVITPIRTARQVDEHLLDLLQPAPFSSRHWRLSQEMRERVFAALCELITRTGTANPQELPVVSFIHCLHAVQAQLPQAA